MFGNSVLCSCAAGNFSGGGKILLVQVDPNSEICDEKFQKCLLKSSPKFLTRNYVYVVPVGSKSST